MQAGGFQWSNCVLLTLALLVTLEVCRVQGCRIGSGSECEKAPFVPGHNLAGEGFDVVRMRRTGAYVINVKGHLADNHTCTLCPNRFQKGQVKTVKLSLLFFTMSSIGLTFLHLIPSKPLFLFFAPPALFFLPLYHSTLPLTIFFLHLHPTLHPSFSLLLRFRGSQQRCSTGVPSAAAVSSFLVPSTTLWTPCCAAPTPWLTTTGVWV